MKEVTETHMNVVLALSCGGHVYNEVRLRYKQIKRLCFFCLLLLTANLA